MPDIEAEYTAKVSGASTAVSGTVDYVDFAIRAEINNWATCTFTLAQCDVTVGNIDVVVGSINLSFGNSLLNTMIDKVTNKATTKISEYILNPFKDELCNAIQGYMDDGSLDLSEVCTNPTYG